MRAGPRPPRRAWSSTRRAGAPFCGQKGTRRVPPQPAAASAAIPTSSRAAGRIRLRLPRGRSDAARNRAQSASPARLRMRGAAPRRVRRRAAAGPIGRIGEGVVAGREPVARQREVAHVGAVHRYAAGRRQPVRRGIGGSELDQGGVALHRRSASGPARARPGRARQRRCRSRLPAPARPGAPERRPPAAPRRGPRAARAGVGAAGPGRRAAGPRSCRRGRQSRRGQRRRRRPPGPSSLRSLARLAQHAPSQGRVLARDGQTARKGADPALPPR